MEGYRTLARTRHQHQGAAGDQAIVLEKAKNIKLILFDVDGVLTDGTIHFTSDGTEAKSFNTQDGFGLRLLQEAGIDSGLISARSSEAVSRRAVELKMRFTFQGVASKLATFQEILKTTGFKPFQVAYMGDDWLDLCLLTRVGLALAPANAAAPVKEAAHYVTSCPGGAGAVREACELILEGRGLRAELLQRYLSR
jgi:3-deoxy-D-manno-octulosonate 8-phosphate phosphatase (KDO 8-P phosphatase)